MIVNLEQMDKKKRFWSKYRICFMKTNWLITLILITAKTLIDRMMTTK